MADTLHPKGAHRGVSVKDVFIREDVACCLEVAKDGWGFRAYCGVEPDHPAAGRFFMPLRRGPALEHVALECGSRALDGKWWFAFDCHRGLEEAALAELAHAADELNAMSTMRVQDSP